MILRLAIVGGVLAGLAVLLVAVTPGGKENLLDFFDGVDGSDKTSVILRYSFKPGQKLLFGSTAEIVTTFDVGPRPGGGIFKIDAKPSFEVLLVDEDGTATLNVLIREMVLETAMGFEHRKVEITPESVRVYERDIEIEPEAEDFQVKEAMTREFAVTVSPRGKVAFVGAPENADMRVTHLVQFLSTHFLELPEEAIAAGDEWLSELTAPEEMPLEEVPMLRNEFLGYRDYEGERCAVLKMSFSLDATPPPGKVGEEESPETRETVSFRFGGGMLFSMNRQLSVVMFKRQEVRRMRSSRGGQFMRASSEEEYVVKLIPEAQ